MKIPAKWQKNVYIFLPDQAMRESVEAPTKLNYLANSVGCIAHPDMSNAKLP
jgi:hypothetical protein